jgi:multisubunit Na+/H+ antiporter MnhE subunit
MQEIDVVMAVFWVLRKTQVAWVSFLIAFLVAYLLSWLERQRLLRGIGACCHVCH